MARKPRERNRSRVPTEMRELAEQVGKFIEFWGFKRIHGEVWLHLFLAREALDAGDLIARLSISKSLASLCLAELVHYEVIRESGKSDAGTTLYEANEDIVGVIANVMRMREKVMLDRIAQVASRVTELPEDTQLNAGLRAERVRYVAEITAEAAGMLELLLARDSRETSSEAGAPLSAERLNANRPSAEIDFLRMLSPPPPSGPEL